MDPFYRHSSLHLPVAVLRGYALQPLRGVVGPLFYVTGHDKIH